MRHVCFLLSFQWILLTKQTKKFDWLFSPKTTISLTSIKNVMFCNSWEVIISNQLQHKVCRGKFAAKTFLGKFRKIRAKYASHPETVACSCTYVSIDGFSYWSSPSVRLAVHGMSSCYVQASVQWFAVEQRLTNGYSLDSIYHIYDLPLHQTYLRV